MYFITKHIIIWFFETAYRIVNPLRNENQIELDQGQIEHLIYISINIYQAYHSNTFLIGHPKGETFFVLFFECLKFTREHFICF